MTGFDSVGPTSIWRIPVPSAKRHAFANPFYTLAQRILPRNIKDVFQWAEHLYSDNGIVAQCLERVVKYPVTDIMYEDEATEVHEKYDDFFKKTIDFKSFTINCGIDLFVYGNSFCSIYFPFTRILKCPKCSLETPVKKAIKVDFKTFKYHATCRCKYRGEMERIDRRSLKEKDTNFIRWNPHQIDISHNNFTGQYEYYYSIPQEDQKRVKAGDLHLINGMPWSFVEAIREKKMIKFSEDSIFHMKQPSLAGLTVEWGLPPVLRTFKLHYYSAILRRANEAIASDYLTPIRVFFPQAGGAINDPGMQLNIAQYKTFLTNMVKQHKTDPADAYFSPLPVGYQALGGEGKALSVSAEIKQANEEIMAALGFPQELFYGTMSVNSAPMALRVFENTFSFYLHAINSLLRWATDKVGAYFDWDKVDPKFTPVTIVDDAERKQMMMQLAGSQLISRDTFLTSIGTSVKEEIKKQMEEARIQEEAQQEAQEKKDAEQMSAQATQQGGPGQGSTVMDINAQAQQVASSWLQLPEGQRRSEMSRMSTANPTLYAMSKTMMEKMRSSDKSDAYYTQQQMQQQGQQV